MNASAVNPKTGLFSAERFAGETAVIAGQDRFSQMVAQGLRAGGAQVFLVGPLFEGDGFIARVMDDPAGIADTFEHIEREAGGVSLLICGAAEPSGDADRWREDLSHGLDAPFFWAAEFARRRVSAGQGGNILFLLDAQVLDASAADPASVAVAHALSNLVKTLSVEWARDGLRINALGYGDDLSSASNLALYLLSRYGAYITGSIAIADGPGAGPGVSI